MKLKPGQNDLFRAETERNEKKKKGHVGPTQIKKKEIRREEEVASGHKFFFFFFSLTSLFDIWKSDRQNSSRQ